MLLAALLAFSSLTFAADGQSGLIAPGAEPMAAGQASIGAAAAAGLLMFAGLTAVGLVEGSYAPHDRVALGGTLGGGFAVAPGGAGTLWVRGSLVEEDWLRVAPYAYGAAIQTEGLGGGFGLALEGGIDRLRLDLSAPVFAVWARPQVPHYDPELRWFPLYGEAGVGVLLGEERRHRLRVGVPALTWRYQGEAFYVEAGATAAVWVGGVLKAGARF